MKEKHHEAKESHLRQRRTPLLSVRLRPANEDGGRLAAHRRRGRHQRGHLRLHGRARGRPVLSVQGGGEIRFGHPAVRPSGLLPRLVQHAKPHRQGSRPSHGADRPRPRQGNGLHRQCANDCVPRNGPVDGHSRRARLRSPGNQGRQARRPQGTCTRLRDRGHRDGLFVSAGRRASRAARGGRGGTYLDDHRICRLRGRCGSRQAGRSRRGGSAHLPDRGHEPARRIRRAEVDRGRLRRLRRAHDVHVLHSRSAHADRLGSGSRRRNRHLGLRDAPAASCRRGQRSAGAFFASSEHMRAGAI